MITALFIILIIWGFSYLIHSAIFWTICWAFNWTFSWKVSLGVWMIYIVIQGLIDPIEKKKGGRS